MNAFWRDVGLWGLVRGVPGRLARTYYNRTHPLAEQSRTPKLGDVPQRKTGETWNWDGLLATLQGQSGVWERHLWPWVRRIEQVVFGQLDPQIRTQMGPLIEYLDGRCMDRNWPEYFVTGSNISAISAGKAAYSLVRYSASGRSQFHKKYRRALSRTHRYIDLAFTRKGAPFEGSMYGLFGLKAVAVLSYLQTRAGITPVASRPRIESFMDYLLMSCVRKQEFALLGDGKAEDFDGSLLSYRYYQLGDRWAGQLLGLIGEDNSRPTRNARLYGDQAPSPFPTDSLPTGKLIDNEKQEVLVRGPNYLFNCIGNIGWGRNHLHLGAKPGSHSIWKEGRWIERDQGYTNAWRNRDSYNPTAMNAPTQGKLTEEAKLTYNGDHVVVGTSSWTETIDMRR